MLGSALLESEKMTQEGHCYPGGRPARIWEVKLPPIGNFHFLAVIARKMAIVSFSEMGFRDQHYDTVSASGSWDTNYCCKP